MYVEKSTFGSYPFQPWVKQNKKLMFWKISVESCFWKEFRGSCKWILKDRSTLFSCLVIQDTLINLFLCIRPETRCKESCSLRRSGSGPVTMSSGQHRAQKEGNSAKKYSMDTWLEGKKERGSKRIILKLLLKALSISMKKLFIRDSHH